MDAGVLTKLGLAFREMVRNPGDVPRWVRNRFDRKSPLELGLACFSWPAVDYVRRHLKPGARVFEWGAGGSTTFLASLGCAVTSVESNEYWRDLVRMHIAQESFPGARPEVRFVAAESLEPALVQQYVDEVRDGAPWDAIFIDGAEMGILSRVACAKAAVNLVPPGGMIILDDSWRPIYAGVPELLRGYRRMEFWGLGPARVGATKTDVYIRPTRE
jgi:hypothetical protein